VIDSVEIEWGSEKCRRHHPAMNMFFRAVVAADHFAADSDVAPEANDENRSMMS
jgi:hypothetical protein